MIGQLEGELSHHGKSTNQPVYVVKDLKTNLLGLPAILALDLVARLEEMVPHIVKRYPTLFQGLGSLGEPYDIQLKPDAQPYALFTSRNIPLPLRSKVEQELKQMESLGIISKIDKPTPWCAGMVVVHKKNGANLHMRRLPILKSVCVSRGIPSSLYRKMDTKDQSDMVYKTPQDACTEDIFLHMGTQCEYTKHRVST